MRILDQADHVAERVCGRCHLNVAADILYGLARLGALFEQTRVGLLDIGVYGAETLSSREGVLVNRPTKSITTQDASAPPFTCCRTRRLGRSQG